LLFFCGGTVFWWDFFLLYGDRQVEVCSDSESLVRNPLARPDETPGPYVDFPMSVHKSRIFFGGIGPCGPVLPPPLEWNSILPLVTTVLIMPKGVEPPGSRRIGVIGALVLILPSETV